MKSRILWGVIVAASLSTGADAHFVLIQPAASLIQNRLGDPQKIGPCGGVSANPGRGTPANPGVPSGAVTNVKGGTDLPLLVQESIYHPGHYRVALARTMAQLPKDPEVTVVQTANGPRSQSAVIQNPPVAPVLLDGIFAVNYQDLLVEPYENKIMTRIWKPRSILNGQAADAAVFQLFGHMHKRSVLFDIDFVKDGACWPMGRPPKHVTNSPRASARSRRRARCSIWRAAMPKLA